MANVLTGIRIICGLLIMVFPAFSNWYFILYITGGLTDAVDGTVARRLGQETDFGAKFDTAADFIFALAVVIKLAGALYFPAWLLIWTGVIILVKISAVAVGFGKTGRFVTVHSLMNKACGLVCFIPPLFLGGEYAWQAKAIVIFFVLIVATAAAAAEFISVLRMREDSER